jgi:hypothetical protein
MFVDPSVCFWFSIIVGAVIGGGIAGAGLCYASGMSNTILDFVR